MSCFGAELLLIDTFIQGETEKDLRAFTRLAVELNQAAPFDAFFSDGAQADATAGKMGDAGLGAAPLLEESPDQVLAAFMRDLRFYRLGGDGIPVYPSAVIFDGNDKLGPFNVGFDPDGTVASFSLL